MTAHPRGRREGQTPAVKPLALPQKEAFRDQPHLYESLEQITEWINTSAGVLQVVSGGGGVPEILIVADTSAADQFVTLPDPFTALPDPKSIVNVKNWNGGLHKLHIGGGAYAIDGWDAGIDTRTNNQCFRFRLALIPEFAGDYGWVCVETCFGGDIPELPPIPPVPPPPPEAPPPIVTDCVVTIPGDASSVDVQLFSGDGTWIRPAGRTRYLVTIIAPGGGGGGGQAHYWGGVGNVGGGGGGGGGEKRAVAGFLADLPATVPITCPAVGGAGAAISGYQDPAVPLDGSTGLLAYFGTPTDAWYVVAQPGKGGKKGATNGGGDGGLGGGTDPASNCAGAPGAIGAFGTLGGSSKLYGAPGGGGGGSGGAGGESGPKSGTEGGLPGAVTPGGGASGGGTPGPTPSSGHDGTASSDPKIPGIAGGGGDGTATFAVYSGNGGKGGWPGAGGGGGGGNSGWGGTGTGGQGAGASVVVECW